MGFRQIIGAVMVCGCYLVFSTLAVIGIFNPSSSPAITLIAIIGMFVLAIITLLEVTNPDHLRARQSDRTLHLASETITFMRQGLNPDSAQAACELLLPVVSAVSVAITDKEKILGFAGMDKKNHEPNTPIQTQVTHETIEDGQTRVVDTAEAIGFAEGTGHLNAAIVVPLGVNKHILGTLKFYYTSPRKIDETQLAIAEGFAQLLSTQLSLSYLEQQTELATRMELKALQAQINPHFLFNTINTIASYARTDPEKARVMLREFATYYRRLLENSEDLIRLSSEIEQTERYLMFQRARFGEDSITVKVDIEDGLKRLRVPAFIVQPIVENAVGHGKREEGTLHLAIRAYHASDSVIISISDDGIGIPSDRLDSVIDSGSKSGMGIALKNVDARLKAYSGALSGLSIESEYGRGTTVSLTLYDALLDTENGDDDE